jgi:hypothetical protein
MDSQDRKYNCKTCNKEYSCYKSLWNHNKKFHSKVVTETVLNDTNTVLNDTKKVYKCIHCCKDFNFRQNKYQHEKICKKKKEATKIEELELEIKKIREELRITNNTTNNTTNNNTTNNNNGTINNTNTTNNINIVGFGKEDINSLTTREKKQILGKGSFGILKLIEKIHFNKNLPQYQNIKITNLRDNYAKIYDDDIKDFKIIKRNETIHKMMNNKGDNLGDILEELEDPQNCYHKGVKNFLDMLNNYSPDMEDKDSLDFYNFMHKEMIILIYNKSKEYNSLNKKIN